MGLFSSLVSVVVPAYNAELYIEATLRSIIAQTYPHIEVIIVDDGSVDHTAQIVESLGKSDDRIKLIRQPNLGVAAARNRGIQASSGYFIAPVDADDICYPEKIEKLLAVMLGTSQHVGLVYGWSAIIDHWGTLTGEYSAHAIEGDVFADLVYSNFIGNASACLIRRKCLDAVGLYNPMFLEQRAQGCEDYDLYLRIAEHFEFRVVRDFLTGYRVTGKGMSFDYRSMEHSRKLVFRGLRQRNPWIPDITLRWAYGPYSLWLSSLAERCGCGQDSILYLFKAALNDPMLIQHPSYIKRLAYASVRFSAAKKLPVPQKGAITLEELRTEALRSKTHSGIKLFKERRRKQVRRLIREARSVNGRMVNRQRG